MNKIIIVFLLVLPFTGFGQFSHKVLKNAPSSYCCNSGQCVRITAEFYHNAMPGSDSNKLHGVIGVGDGIVEPYGVICPQLKFQKWFYFYGNELYVQTLGKPSPWSIGAKFSNQTPDMIVAEFKDQKTGKYIYIKKTGGFAVGQVE
ncbi:MAG: hypothetical protein ACPGED_00415 [Flavobacteriales bacterium]